MKTLKWGKMSKPTPVFLKGLRNFCMKVGTSFISAAGALTYFLKEHSKDAPVPEYAWYIVFIIGSTGVLFSAGIVPFVQSFYLDDDTVSKKQ